jgi:hypothetical protein
MEKMEGQFAGTSDKWHAGDPHGVALVLAGDDTGQLPKSLTSTSHWLLYMMYTRGSRA